MISSLQLSDGERTALLEYVYSAPPLRKQDRELMELYSNPIYQRAMDNFTYLWISTRFIETKVSLWKEVVKTRYVPLSEFLRMTHEEHLEYYKDSRNIPEDYLDRWQDKPNA